MKLRIRGNSIRLRLQRGEVVQLAESGRVEDRVVFGPDEQLVYAVESHRDQNIALLRAPGEIAVRLALEDVTEWAESDQVGFEAIADNGEDGLTILIEKDFSCLITRSDVDDVGTYPNPRAGKK